MPAFSQPSGCQILVEATNSEVNVQNVEDLLIKKSPDGHPADNTTYILKRRHSWSKRESVDTNCIITSKNILTANIFDYENLDPNGNHLISHSTEKIRSFKDIKVAKSVSWTDLNLD